MAGEAGSFPHPEMRAVVEILRRGLDGLGTELLHLRLLGGRVRNLDAFGFVLERRLFGVGAQRDTGEKEQGCEEAGECFHEKISRIGAPSGTRGMGRLSLSRSTTSEEIPKPW